MIFKGIRGETVQDINFCFQNRNYVVVGASSGIGKQITLDLAESGANVLAIARNNERLDDVRLLYPDKITTAVINVLCARDNDWRGVLDPFVTKYGKINGGIYTAGISKIASLKMLDEEDARDVVETSFWGMLFFLKFITRKKYSCVGSSFVVFSSAASYIGQKGGIAYAAAKAAVSNAVKSIASEIAANKQRINSISPGWVKTNMTELAEQESGGIVSSDLESAYPLGLGVPKNISGMALFLMSDAASWITGSDVVIDGGFLVGRF